MNVHEALVGQGTKPFYVRDGDVIYVPQIHQAQLRAGRLRARSVALHYFPRPPLTPLARAFSTRS